MRWVLAIVIAALLCAPSRSVLLGALLGVMTLRFGVGLLTQPSLATVFATLGCLLALVAIHVIEKGLRPKP
jgi:hypothetical protein